MRNFPFRTAITGGLVAIVAFLSGGAITTYMKPEAFYLLADTYRYRSTVPAGERVEYINPQQFREGERSTRGIICNKRREIGQWRIADCWYRLRN